MNARTPDEIKANARLIAAAPELLEAAILSASTMKQLLFQLPRGCSVELKAEFERHIELVKAAIAKAE